jgi:hypothetical protein
MGHIFCVSIPLRYVIIIIVIIINFYFVIHLVVYDLSNVLGSSLIIDIISINVACAIGSSVTMSSSDFSFQNLIFWNLFEFLVA